MIKLKTGPAILSRISLSVAVILAMGFFASRAQAQDGKKLDAPVAAPAPSQTRAPAPPSAMKAAILRKAEVAYYILQSQGVKAFQCNIQPNWAQIVTDPAKLAVVRHVQYATVIDPQGAIQATPFIANGLAIDPSVQDLAADLQQTVVGFFQTWNSLVLSPVFSPTDDAQLVYSSQADGYHFAQKTTDANVDIVMTKDGVITEMKVTTPSSVIAMQPMYIPTENGLLLSSINSDIDHGKQKVNFQIQYQTVDGFEVPEIVAYQVTLPSQVVSIDMGFSGYQIVKQ